MRKLLTLVLSAAMTISLFAQTSHSKYGDSGAPEVRIPQTMNLTNTRDAEDYILYLVDSFGDGWNGAAVDILVNGTLVLDDATITTGSEAIFYLSVDNGDVVTTEWTSGSYDSECAFGLYNHYGILVAQNDENYSLSYTVVHTEIANGQFEDYTPQDNG